MTGSWKSDNYRDRGGAVHLFEQQGLVVHPVATDHEVGSPNARMNWLPDASALDGSGRAFK